MTARPSVLCPVDFSAASRSALYHAAAFADHFGARLTVLAVDDPLLEDVAASTGRVPSLAEETRSELGRFAAAVINGPRHHASTVDLRVVVAKPAAGILQVAAEIGADVIVMSSQGRSGVRKLFFGSTTERVLRETTVPVLVTTGEQSRPGSVAEIGRHLHRVLAPVDLSAASPHQVAIAGAIALAFSRPLIVAHVIEPIFIPASLRAVTTGIDAQRRVECEEGLAALAAGSPAAAATESIVVSGDPSEEIVKLASVREAGLIVMGLHSSVALGPRMGSVTYRVLCLAHTLVLALPPQPDAAAA
jgi:nucleotide-binding universal stress UspA family protein